MEGRRWSLAVFAEGGAVEVVGLGEGAEQVGEPCGWRERRSAGYSSAPWYSASVTGSIQVTTFPSTAP